MNSRCGNTSDTAAFELPSLRHNYYYCNEIVESYDLGVLDDTSVGIITINLIKLFN